MRRYKKMAIALAVTLCMMPVGCGNSQEKKELVDGYYTAVMSEYSHGWKEFVNICVMDNKIVSVEYNARNKAGFIKSWDGVYMRNMNAVQGTYPNHYTRTYAGRLLDSQGKKEIDLLAGASSSGGNFQRMTTALLEHARTGNTEIAVVESETHQEE